jgi:drug/metabolite transporter (DMT)-like permease
MAEGTVMSLIALILALGCAAMSNVALLCEHRGAVRAPDIRFSRPLQSAGGLFRSPWWAIGFGIGCAAWLLHVAALTIAPLSMVQAVIAGGLALLALPARHWFGITLGRKELIGLGLAATGLAFLAITATGDAGDARDGYSTSAMIGFEGSVVAIGAALLLSASAERGARHGGLLLGASAGLLLGVSDVAIKALSADALASPLALVSPWTLIAVLGGIGAFYSLARSLQLGDPVEVAVIASVASNVAAIVGGVLVFGDPVGSNAFAVAARGAAFAAVITAAALVPTAKPSRAPVTPQHA